MTPLDRLALKLKDPGLAFAAFVICSLLAVAGFMKATTDTWWAYTIFSFLFLGLSLGSLGMYFHYRDKRDRRLLKQMRGLLDSINQRGVQLIDTQGYRTLLSTWNASGKGRLVMINIELQSFLDEELFKKTWGDISNFTNVISVELILPIDKIARWESVVKKRKAFFEVEQNRKFNVSQSVDPRLDGSSLAFACFVQGEDYVGGDIHENSVAFLLAAPFSTRSQGDILPGTNAPDQWWNYHFVLQFNKAELLDQHLRRVLTDEFSVYRGRDVLRILEDTSELVAKEPGKLFDQLQMAAARKAQLLPYLSERNRADCTPTVEAVNADWADEQLFEIAYGNGDKVSGKWKNAGQTGDDKKPAIIWVGGFTETEKTDIAGIFEKALGRIDAVQFYYRNSTPVEHATMTRYRQDMQEVLSYVDNLPFVNRNKIVLVARSINGLVAAQVASNPQNFNKIVAVLLIAPVFDVLELIGNYQKRNGVEGADVEACWRVRPGLTADKWEDVSQKYLEFFGQKVSLCLFADIVRQPPGTFTLESFVSAIGRISHQMVIRILSHPKDEIVGSLRAKNMLDAAVESGRIDEERYSFVEINSRHRFIAPERRISFELKDEALQTRKAIEATFDDLGISVNRRPRS